MYKFIRNKHHIGIMIYEAEIKSLENGTQVDSKFFLRRKSAEKMFNKMNTQIHNIGEEDKFVASYGGEILWIT